MVDVDEADVIVIGGACDDFTYATMNRIFRRLMDGAVLVGMHRNLFWKTSDGWELDGGAYIAGLEEAAETRATICGKPNGRTSSQRSRCWGSTQREPAWWGTTS